MLRISIHSTVTLVAGLWLFIESKNIAFAEAKRETFKVIRSFPHDQNAYTQGFVFHKGKFIEGTGVYGRSSLRLVDISTGKVDKIVPLASHYFGEGVALAGNAIVQLTWRRGSAFIYNINSFELVGTINYPGEGWGLTFDGTRFIMSNGSSSLTFRDPSNFEFQSHISVRDQNGPVRNLNELEWINGEIWANQWQTDRIARISPDTGEVRSWVDLEGIFDWATLNDIDAVLNGIAYDNESDRIFVTGKLWPWVFEIEVAEEGNPDATEISLENISNNELLISFPTFKNSLYQLERLSDLNPSTIPQIEGSIVGTGHTITRNLTALQGQQSYYRIVGLSKTDP